MKVLQVLPSLSLKLGGPTQVALNTARHLIDLGVECEIATTDDDDQELVCETLGPSSRYRSIPIHFFKASRFKYRQFIPSFALTKWLWQNVQRFDLIDIHYFFTYSSTVAAFIARRKKVPYSVRPMGQLTDWCLGHKNFRKRLYWAISDRSMIQGAALIQCTSQAEIEDVRRAGGDTSKCALLPLGAETSPIIPAAKEHLHERLGIPKHDSVLLFMSRLHEKKRPDFLIKALRGLKDKDRAVQLIIAGDGEPGYASELRMLVSKYSLESRVHFLGFLSGEEKSLVLQGSDIFVLPSHSENFGVAIAEAMHARVPVVISRNIQIAEDIAKANAGVVFEGGEESLVNGLLELVDSHELRGEMGKNAEKLAAEQYSWPQIAKRMKQVYASVAQQR